MSSMDPNLLGELHIAVLLISLLVWIAKARTIRMSTSTASILAAKVSFWGIAGSRGFHCLDYWDFYGSAIWKIFDPSIGGLSLWGAFLAGTVALIIYGRGLEIGVLRLADATVLPVAAGYLIGKIGWAVIGAPPAAMATDYPWGVAHEVNMVSEAIDVAVGQLMTVHPVVIYEFLWATVIYAILLFSIKFTLIPGMRFIQLVSGLALGRFFIGFVRVDPNHVGNLDLSQLISLLMLVAGVLTVFKLWMTNNKSIRSSLDDDRSIDSPRY